MTQTCSSPFIFGGAGSPPAHRSIAVPQAHSPSAHLRCRLCRLTLNSPLTRRATGSPLNYGATGSLTLTSPLTTCGAGSHSTVVQARPRCTLTTHVRCRRLTLNSPLTCGAAGSPSAHYLWCRLTFKSLLTCGGGDAGSHSTVVHTHRSIEVPQAHTQLGAHLRCRRLALSSSTSTSDCPAAKTAYGSNGFAACFAFFFADASSLHRHRTHTHADATPARAPARAPQRLQLATLAAANSS